MTIGRQLLAAAVSVPLLLTGCGGDPDPQVAPPEPSASTTLPSPQPPEPWQRKTKAGAVAFAEHWIEVFNEAATSGDPRPMLALSGRSCETCANFAKLIRSIHRDGGSFESAGWSLASFSFGRIDPRGEVTMAMEIKQPREVIRRPGEKIEVTPPGTATYQAGLSWKEGAWSMASLTFVQA